MYQTHSLRRKVSLQKSTRPFLICNGRSTNYHRSRYVGHISILSMCANVPLSEGIHGSCIISKGVVSMKSICKHSSLQLLPLYGSRTCSPWLTQRLPGKLTFTTTDTMPQTNSSPLKRGNHVESAGVDQLCVEPKLESFKLPNCRLDQVIA